MYRSIIRYLNNLNNEQYSVIKATVVFKIILGFLQHIHKFGHCRLMISALVCGVHSGMMHFHRPDPDDIPQGMFVTKRFGRHLFSDSGCLVNFGASIGGVQPDTFPVPASEIFRVVNMLTNYLWLGNPGECYPSQIGKESENPVPVVKIVHSHFRVDPVGSGVDGKKIMDRHFLLLYCDSSGRSGDILPIHFGSYFHNNPPLVTFTDVYNICCAIIDFSQRPKRTENDVPRPNISVAITDADFEIMRGMCIKFFGCESEIVAQLSKFIDNQAVMQLDTYLEYKNTRQVQIGTVTVHQEGNETIFNARQELAQWMIDVLHRINLTIATSESIDRSQLTERIEYNLPVNRDEVEDEHNDLLDTVSA